VVSAVQRIAARDGDEHRGDLVRILVQAGAGIVGPTSRRKDTLGAVQRPVKVWPTG
jgi:hypothetical protein